MRHNEYEKFISVARLKSLLEYLPNDDLLTVNAVGNVAVFAPDAQSYRGFIDFAEETLELKGNVTL